jgi:hypothetical protein
MGKKPSEVKGFSHNPFVEKTFNKRCYGKLSTLIEFFDLFNVSLF